MKEKNKEYIIISILPVMMLIYSLYLCTPYEIITGIKSTILSNNLLITDYFKIANIGSTLFQSALITLINIYILYRLKLKLNGLLITALYLMTSFSFMGKNIINIIPFYIGGLIYTKVNKKNIKSTIPIIIMSTALAPLASNIFPIGFILAILVGYIMPVIMPHTLHYHDGYSLYNSGLAGGLLGVIIYSLFKSSHIDLQVNNDLFLEFRYDLFFFFLIYYILMIAIGIINEKNFLNKTKKLYSHSGRLVTDFIQKDGFYVTIINLGVLGLICLFICLYYQVLNGPVICAMLTITAFSGFGKHPKNTLPLLIGVFIANIVFKIEISTTLFLITLFFSTTFAPITGKFGILVGIFIGFIHYAISIHTGIVHGGLNLYNNGLAAGILASVFVPIAEGGLFWKKQKRK